MPAGNRRERFADERVGALQGSGCAFQKSLGLEPRRNHGAAGGDLKTILRGDANSAMGLLQTRHLRAVINFKTRALPRSQEAMSQAVRINLTAVLGKKRGGA